MNDLAELGLAAIGLYVAGCIAYFCIWLASEIIQHQFIDHWQAWKAARREKGKTDVSTS